MEDFLTQIGWKAIGVTDAVNKFFEKNSMITVINGAGIIELKKKNGASYHTIFKGKLRSPMDFEKVLSVNK